MERPKEQQFCPVCEQPMHWFGDHWLCVNIKVHDNAANQRRRQGQDDDPDPGQWDEMMADAERMSRDQ